MLLCTSEDVIIEIPKRQLIFFNITIYLSFMVIRNHFYINKNILEKIRIEINVRLIIYDRYNEY